MSSYLTALQLNLLGLAVLVGVRRLCRTLRYPAPPLKLPLLAAVLMPWLTLIESSSGHVINASLLPYLDTLNTLIGSYAAIQLIGWLALDIPPQLGLWKALPKILGDLITLGVGTIITLALIHYQLKINLIGIAATSAVLTAVIGLAAQSTLKDIFAGIALQVDAPFKQGDWIDLGFARGIVLSLRLMSTRLSTIDGAQIVIPNSRITSDGMRRFRPFDPIGHSFEIALDFTFPARRAIQLLEDVLVKHPRTLKQPHPQAWVSRYSEAGLIYQVQYWQKEIGDTAEYKLRSELLEQIWYSLQRAGQTIPYPGLDLRQKPNTSQTSLQDLTTEQRIEILATNKLFKHLSPEQLSQLGNLARCLTYAPNELVVRQGEYGNTLYIVATGTLGVTTQGQDDSHLHVNILKPGDVFGEMAVCTGAPRTADVTSLEESRLLEIEREDLLVLIKQDRTVLDRLSSLIATRAQELKEASDSNQRKDHQALTQKIKYLFEGLLNNFK
jgi:small-conductance mechanosensitive channel